jgi:hypothetical protein
MHVVVQGMWCRHTKSKQGHTGNQLLLLCRYSNIVTSPHLCLQLLLCCLMLGTLRPCQHTPGISVLLLRINPSALQGSFLLHIEDVTYL